MAKKKAVQRKKQTFNDAVGITGFLQSERTDFLLGLIVTLFSIFAFVAMGSYLSTCATDQSILENMRPGEWLNNDKVFTNICKSWGAILSYFLISENFGYAAFLIPFFMFQYGLKMMQIYSINLLKWFFGTMVTMLWLSLFLSKVLTPLLPDAIFNPGGRHGAMCVEFIENVMGAPGLTCILFFTAITFMTFVSKETITWFRKIFNPLKTITSRANDIIAERKGDDTEDADTEDGDKDIDTDNADERAKDENAITPQDDKPAVIDLTDMASPDNGGNVTKAGDDNKKTSLSDTGNADKEAPTLKTGAENLTVEVGKDERANEISNHSNVTNTPINPLEPFLRYKYPSLSLMNRDDNDGKPYVDMDEIKTHNEEIIRVLKSFGIEIKEIKATVGPTITLYEITPAEGIRITKIRNLEDDIALRLSALGVRIIAPIPGKGTIGIEVPNKKRHNVSMESILSSKKFQETKYDLPIALGKTITNEVFMADLTKIPHLLVAGATGQGKSVGLNVILTSLLYKKHPNELKLVLIDPKKVEFSVYERIANHFMAQVDSDDEPIITDVTKVVRTLKSLCTLMDHRYDLLKMAGARNIKEYNEKFLNRRLNPELGHEFMPYIVVIIDEFGDLIMTAGKEVEMPIARIAQLARAVGIHMIIATQRPTTSIITGNIKANFPGRIAFKVSSMMDSRIILDRPGANQLIGMGDMLYLNGNEPTRVQCAFISTTEIGKINEFVSTQPGPICPMELPEPATDEADTSSGSGDIGSLDPLFEEAARSVILSQQGSTSMIQRRYSIGYNRAGRLMDQLEKAGIVGAAHGSKPREVLLADESQLAEIMARLQKN